MPTYEYACEKCGHQFEKFQSMADKPLSRCPAELCPRKPAGRGKVRKMISGGAGLIFKGSGFYITDYRSENYKQGAKKDSPGGGDTKSGDAKSAGASGGTEAKPSAKAETKTESKSTKPSAPPKGTP
jgi:putative FmdB family regulatory protein